MIDVMLDVRLDTAPAIQEIHEAMSVLIAAANAFGESAGKLGCPAHVHVKVTTRSDSSQVLAGWLAWKQGEDTGPES